MILDHDLLASDDQTLAFNIGSAASTNVLDLGALGVGRGNPVKVFCEMTAAFDSAGDTGTVEFFLQGHDDDAFGATTTLYDSGAIAQATLVAGYRPIDIYLPLNAPRYIRFYYTIASANGSGGTVTAGIILDEQTNDDPVALGLTS